LFWRSIPAVGNDTHDARQNKKKYEEKNLFHIFLLNLLFMPYCAMATLARPVVLIGLMGVGKTTIGMKTAEILNIPFIDSDDLIPLQAGSSIEDIFEESGEAVFRQFEFSALQTAAEQVSRPIIASGGGAVTHPPTLDYLRRHCYLVWLDISIPLLVSRLRDNPGDRPLLKKTGASIAEQVVHLADQRRPLYEKAHVRLKCNKASVMVTATLLADHLRSVPDLYAG
jgi:shikimate kinase